MVPDCTAATAAQTLYKHWICLFGCPTAVVTHGAYFTSQDFIDAADKLGYRIKHTTPYHPQSNGIAERRLRELSKAIRIYSNTMDAWEEIIPEVLLAFHNTINRTTGYSPAQLMIGQQLRLPYESNLASSSLVDIDSEVAKQVQAEHTMTTNVIKAKEDAVSKERITGAQFHPGDSVFMYNDVPIPGIPQKVQIPYNGPFRVTKVYGQTAELSDGDKEMKANVTKFVRLRNLTVPQSDPKGRIEKASDAEEKTDKSVGFHYVCCHNVFRLYLFSNFRVYANQR